MRTILRALCASLLFFCCATAFAQTGSRMHPHVTPLSPMTAAPIQKQAIETPSVATLTEGFNDITTLTSAGWYMQNNSSPLGGTNWFQGTSVASSGPFDSHAGATNAYIAANFNNTTGSTGTISNWLLTPELDFGANASFTFYTRKPTGQDYPDRLEVRLSTSGASTNIGTGATGTGDFGTTLLEINPTLVAGGYPYTWTAYTISHAQGLPHSGTGRIAFRYYVTGAGPTGTNSDYIGIDTVSYSAGAPEYTLGGTVSGLAGSGLSLSLNGGTALAIGANGSFQFPGYVSTGTIYTVQVQTQPGTPSQTCTVANGSGTMTDTVTNVAVTCTTNTFAVSGSITGLAGNGFILQNNGGGDLAIPVGATSFAFPAQLDLSTYAISVFAQPGSPTQTCTIANGSGTIGSANVTNVAITCVTNTYTIGGTVGGLTGSGLVLATNGQTLPVSTSGNFTFPTAIASGATYAVTVQTQPSSPTQTCTIPNGSGTIGSANVTNVAITCVTNTYTISGTVSGLAGSGLVLATNGQTLPVSTSGNFTFPTAIASGATYAVTVQTQPTSPTQTCTVANGSGTIGSADITNVAITCTTNTYTIGGTVNGLTGSGLALATSGQTLPVTANGSFTFTSALASGSIYAVVVQAQPRLPYQVCSVTNGAGTIGGANIANVAVNCIADIDTIFVDGFDDAGPLLAKKDQADAAAGVALVAGDDETLAGANSTHHALTGVLPSSDNNASPRGTPAPPVQLPTLGNAALALLAVLLAALAWHARRNEV